MSRIEDKHLDETMFFLYLYPKNNTAKVGDLGSAIVT